MAFIKNISQERGDTRRYTFTIKDKKRNIIDISAWTNFVLTVNSEVAPEDTTNQLALLTGSFSTDGTDGRVYFVPEASWPKGVYYYDAQAIDANGEKLTWVKGKLSIGQDISKS